MSNTAWDTLAFIVAVLAYATYKIVEIRTRK